MNDAETAELPRFHEQPYLVGILAEPEEEINSQAWRAFLPQRRNFSPLTRSNPARRGKVAAPVSNHTVPHRQGDRSERGLSNWKEWYSMNLVEGQSANPTSQGWSILSFQASGENAERRIKMYPEEMVRPMREELTRIGFREMRTAAEVDAVLRQAKGTVLVAVNSICGCAAGRARPAVALALAHKARPDVLATVFAGQDAEATAQARSYFTGYLPSSPQIGLLRDGRLVFMLERHDIEGRDAEDIAEDLRNAFDRFCTPAGMDTGKDGARS